MPSELVGTSVIFVKVAPTYVERTLTALRAKSNVTKAESVFGRHDIAIAGAFRHTDALRACPACSRPRRSRRSRSTRTMFHGRAQSGSSSFRFECPRVVFSLDDDRGDP